MAHFYGEIVFSKKKDKIDLKCSMNAKDVLISNEYMHITYAHFLFNSIQMFIHFCVATHDLFGHSDKFLNLKMKRIAMQL